MDLTRIAVVILVAVILALIVGAVLNGTAALVTFLVVLLAGFLGSSRL